MFHPVYYDNSSTKKQLIKYEDKRMALVCVFAKKNFFFMILKKDSIEQKQHTHTHTLTYIEIVSIFYCYYYLDYYSCRKYNSSNIHFICIFAIRNSQLCRSK